MPTIRSIVSWVEPNLDKQTKQNKKEKEKSTMPTFSFDWCVDQYQTSNRRKEEARSTTMTTPTVPSFWQPTRKIEKKGSKKEEGTPCPSHQHNHEEEPTPTVRSIVSSVQPNAEKQAKQNKNEEEKEKPMMPTFFVHSIGIRQATKKRKKQDQEK